MYPLRSPYNSSNLKLTPHETKAFPLFVTPEPLYLKVLYPAPYFPETLSQMFSLLANIIRLRPFLSYSFYKRTHLIYHHDWAMIFKMFSPFCEDFIAKTGLIRCKLTHWRDQQLNETASMLYCRKTHNEKLIYVVMLKFRTLTVESPIESSIQGRVKEIVIFWYLIPSTSKVRISSDIVQEFLPLICL